MNLERMRKMVKILEEAGVSENRYFDMEHDILYIPYEVKDDPTASQLEDIGCHWDNRANSWASY